MCSLQYTHALTHTHRTQSHTISNKWIFVWNSTRTTIYNSLFRNLSVMKQNEYVELGTFVHTPCGSVGKGVLAFCTSGNKTLHSQRTFSYMQSIWFFFCSVAAATATVIVVAAATAFFINLLCRCSRWFSSVTITITMNKILALLISSNTCEPDHPLRLSCVCVIHLSILHRSSVNWMALLLSNFYCYFNDLFWLTMSHFMWANPI